MSEVFWASVYVLEDKGPKDYVFTEKLRKDELALEACVQLKVWLDDGFSIERLLLYL